jgi:predicted RNA binding protein YcfA (HicA-like mRNA interferase family)
MKVRDIIRLIEHDGWYYVTCKGDHRQYKHPNKPGKVTISGHLGDDVRIGTLRSILRQAQIARENDQ